MKKLFILLILVLSCFIYGEEKVLYNKVITNSNPKIRIATYNIAAGANNFKVDLKLTANAIKKINPDIIALQEVDRNTERSGKIDQIKILSELKKTQFQELKKQKRFL